MVNTLKNGGETVHRCGECGLTYSHKETARRCEAWCKEHNSCNLEIIKSAVLLRNPDAYS